MEQKTMAEINEYLYDRQVKLGMDFGLSRMETLLAGLDNPHGQVKFIHIAGSNGKGSTLNFIKEILHAEGLHVGAFTSPYLECVNEQLSVDKSIITDREFISLFQEVYAVVEEMDEAEQAPTQFEILTAMAFLYFKQCDVDIALLETGLGGRMDSTNVVTPLLSIITSISLEHTNILGNSIAEIAREKAGIIKKGIPVISGVKDAAAFQVIQDSALAENAQLYQLDKDFFIDQLDRDADRQTFSYQMGDYALNDIELTMLGRHQAENASLAVTAIMLLAEFTIHEASIRKGLRDARWSARFELLTRDPSIVLDGAHNPAGISALLETLQNSYPGRKYRFIFTALKDKNYKEMIAILDQSAGDVTFTEIPHERAAAAESLFESCTSKNKSLIKDWQSAIDNSLENAIGNDILILTGSLYFLSLARPYLQRKLHEKS